MGAQVDITVVEAAIGLGLLLLGMAVATLILLPAQRAARGARGELEPIRRAQGELAGRLSQLAEQSAEGQERLRQTVSARLDAVGERVGASIADTQARSAENLQALHERLALIGQAQATIEALSGEVSGLSAVLSDKQARGAFGETQMRDLIESYLPPRAVSFQATLSNATRVDALIHLPGEGADVAVDAKFPLEAWRAMAAADGPDAQARARRAFAADVNRHVADIARKYLLPGETHEVALMFLPSEAIYAELHAGFPEVVDRSFRARVMVVSPTTFMATLHTMRAVMRDAAMREQAGVILREVARMAEDVGRLDERVGRLARHFEQAGEDVRQIRISTEKITRRAGRMEELEERVDVGELPEGVVPLRG